jgi:hypothetical protein
MIVPDGFVLCGVGPVLKLVLGFPNGPVFQSSNGTARYCWSATVRGTQCCVGTGDSGPQPGRLLWPLALGSGRGRPAPKHAHAARAMPSIFVSAQCLHFNRPLSRSALTRCRWSIRGRTGSRAGHGWLMDATPIRSTSHKLTASNSPREAGGLTAYFAGSESHLVDGP